jgi:phage terminase Nu1 subunit (DNA packaging protein)
MAPAKKKAKAAPDQLKSWKAISEYLHKPVTTVKRWAEQGMPVQREGRFVSAQKGELAKWLGEGDEVRGSVHVTTPGEDLTTELRESLTAVRKRQR